MNVDGDEGEDEGEGADQTSPSNPPNDHQTINRRNSRAESRSDAPSSATSQHLPDLVPPFPVHESRSRHSSGSSLSAPTVLRPQIPPGTRPYSQTPIPLTHDEAVLVHHYTEHLGRWLDCTDATRQFTLGVPGKVKLCPVLCHAVLSFAARHRKEEATAEAAYQRCIALLIDRLNEDAASHDETLLCAIVILRFYEQLSGTCPSPPVCPTCIHVDWFQFRPIQAPMTKITSLGRLPFCALLRDTILSTPRRPHCGRLPFGFMFDSACTWLPSINSHLT
jgi:hypothetical protein